MIRELFLPSLLKGRRYFSESSLGISLEPTNIRAVLSQLTPAGNIVENIFSYSIPKPEKKELENNSTFQLTSLITPLQKLKKAVHQPDNIRLSIPSSLVVLKELEMPFCNRDKIKMVVEYEVEPLLPFPIQEAFVDFIITSKSLKGKSCRIIVAAVRKSDVEKLLDVCQEAQLIPHYIFVDLFAAYGLLQTIGRKEKPHTTALIEIEPHTTKVAMLEIGALRFVRNIHYGSLSFIESLQNATDLPPEECKQKFEVYGVQTSKNTDYNSAIDSAINLLAKDIIFALDSFRMQATNFPEIRNVTILQRDCFVKGFASKLEKIINLKCHDFPTEILTTKNIIENKSTSRASDLSPYVTALGTAIVRASHNEFDLGGDFTAQASKKLFKRQLLTGGILTAILIGCIGLYGYFQLSALAHQANTFETKAIKTFKSLFPKDKRFARKIRLKKLSLDSKQIVAEHESRWNNFGCQDTKPLETILELITITDKNKFNTIIDNLRISTNDTGNIVLDLAGSLTTQGERAKLKGFIERFRQAKLLELLEFTEGSYDSSLKTTAFTAQMSMRQS